MLTKREFMTNMRREYRKQFKKPKDAKRARAAQGSTRGKDKGEACQASSLDRYMAFHNKSYKHPQYRAWYEKTKISSMS